MQNPITNRYEFVYLFDVENGNPNGDPDSGNMPRIDPETSYGLVTDVCLKRKVRNYVDIVQKNEAPYKIYVREGAVLTTERQGAYQSLGDAAKKGKLETKDIARQFMCKNYFDVRTFGAVMSMTENNCGQVRGPVQFNFSKSVAPVVPMDITITRMAVEREAEKDDERTMGRKQIIPYGLYRMEGYVSALLAQQTGFSEDDLQLLWDALINMFDHDHSAARGKMNSRKLVVFEHESALGNAPSHKLFELIHVEQKGDHSEPARAFSDYFVSIKTEDIPKGVSIQDKI